MKIKLSSTPTRPCCRVAREFLEKHGVSYEDVNVAEDRQGAKEMIEKSGQLGIPVIDVDGSIIVGFDRGRIESALGL